jgi:hypothetical protein
VDWRHDDDGRLLGNIFQRGSMKLLVASVYMPTGLDFAREQTSSFVLASKLSDTLLSWSRDCDFSVIMGDFNETVSPFDHQRFGGNEVSVTCRAMAPIVASFSDIFRVLNPHSPGFTNFPLSSDSPARLDYIFVSPALARFVRSCSVLGTVSMGSTHRLLFADMDLPSSFRAPSHVASPASAFIQFGLSSDDQKIAFASSVERALDNVFVPWTVFLLDNNSQISDRDRLNVVFTLLTDLVFALGCKFLRFRKRGGKPGFSKSVCQLRVRRRVWLSLACLVDVVLGVGPSSAFSGDRDGPHFFPR